MTIKEAADELGVKITYFKQRYSAMLTNVGNSRTKVYDLQEVRNLKEKIKEQKLKKGPKRHL
jgi:hypothetical protein